jgi:DNA polymerase-3 subunit alpha
VQIPDPRLSPIVGGTYGVILYQEQAMLISKSLAGFSGARADDLRKAIGKKNREAMAKLKPEFIEGCRKSGTDERLIEQLWTTNEKSADYSFNKSHAACYALIAYRTAWLKANHPAEYMAALISSVMDTKDKVPFFVAKTEDMGIQVLPPDVNLSDHEFVVVEGSIRFGLDAVKGVGYAAVEGIKRAREEGGEFTSIWDFCARVDCRAVNKRAIEALIKCGAFGSTGASRKGMLDVLEAAQAAGAKQQQDLEIGRARSSTCLRRRRRGGDRLGGAAFAARATRRSRSRSSTSPTCSRSRRSRSASSSPRTRSRTCARRCAWPSTRRCPSCPSTRTASGSRSAASSPRSRRSRPRRATRWRSPPSTTSRARSRSCSSATRSSSTAARSTSTRSSSSAAASTTRTRARSASSCSPSIRSSRPRRSARRPRRSSPSSTSARSRCTCASTPRGCPATFLDELKDVLETFPGESDVVLEMACGTGRRTLRLGASYRVSVNASLRAELEHVLGPAALPSAEPATAAA